MRSLTRAATLVALCLASLAPAQAAKITDHFDVSIPAASFTVFSGPALTGPVTLSFDLTFDPTITPTPDTTSGFANVTHDFALASPIGYQIGTYPNNPARPGFLTIGGTQDTVPLVLFGTSDDFYLHIADINTKPTFQQFGLSTTSGYYFTPTDPLTFASTAANVTFQVTRLSGPSPVPLPASLPMFGAALFGVAAFGLGLKRRRSAAQA